LFSSHPPRNWHIGLLGLAFACTSTGPDRTAEPPGLPPPPVTQPVRMGISHSSDTAIVGRDPIQLSTFILDRDGNRIDWWPHTLRPLDPDLAQLDFYYRVSAIRPGLARFELRSDSLVTLAETLTVRMLPRVAYLRLSPRIGTLSVGQELQFEALLFDSLGTPIVGRYVEWGGGGDGTVSATGLVRAVRVGHMVIGAVSEFQRDTLAIDLR